MKILKSLTVLLTTLAIALGAANAQTGAPPAVIEGQITFDFYPVVGDAFEMNNPVRRPARGVTVRAAPPANLMNPISTTTTDANGDYSLVVPSNIDVVIQARAEMRNGAQWNYSVVQPGTGAPTRPVYTLESRQFTTVSGQQTRNLHASSGWNSATNRFGILADRDAAPFSILDAVLEAQSFFLAARPTTNFPRLIINWSDRTRTSQYDPNNGEITLWGDQRDDIDEFDHHVIVHEWLHYFEDNFSRQEDIGGRHPPGGAIDPRLNFIEGWANALSGIILGRPEYTDVWWDDPRNTYITVPDDFEQNNNCPADNENTAPFRQEFNTRGIYSECAVTAMIFDIFDGIDAAESDSIQINADQIFTTFANHLRQHDYFITPMTFLEGLETNGFVNRRDLLAVLGMHNITTFEFGSIQFPPPGRLLTLNGAGGLLGQPSYQRPIAQYSHVRELPFTENVCVTDVFGRWGNRFLVNRLFAIRIDATRTLNANLTSNNTAANPALRIYRRGDVPQFEATGVATTLPGGTVMQASISQSLTPGLYILEVSDQRFSARVAGASVNACATLAIN